MSEIQESTGRDWKDPSISLQASLCACLGVHPSILFYPKLYPESIFPSLLNNIICSRRTCFPVCERWCAYHTASAMPGSRSSTDITRRGDSSLERSTASGVWRQMCFNSHRTRWKTVPGTRHGKNRCMVLSALAWSAGSGVLPWGGSSVMV